MMRSLWGAEAPPFRSRTRTSWDTRDRNNTGPYGERERKRALEFGREHFPELFDEE
jgi:hypothetical protein